MIIDNKSNQNELLGDITEYKASIDIEDINFITTLLSSNLYSRPEESFLREIVSNAWDSHIAAKTTDTPILISINTNDYSVTIRDFGTGLSKKEFENIYTKIGKSTKRHSNDYIGSFGIGKYAALACSNVVNIISYYNGKKFSYVLIKNGNNITFNLLEESDTEEKNGLSVKVSNINIIKILDALKVIRCFPNVYIDFINSPNKNYYTGNEDFNATKIKKFNNFIVTNTKIYREGILIGNVPYEINNIIYTYLTLEQKNFLLKICQSNCMMTFDIGDFEITPNRESVIYNDTAIEKFKEKLDKTKEEIDAIIKPLMEKECTIEEILNLQDNYSYYDFFNNVIYNSKVKLFTFEVDVHYHYKGTSVTREMIRAIGYYSIPFIIKVRNGLITTPKNRSYWYEDVKLKNAYFKIMSCSSKYTPKVKEFLKEKYNGLLCVGSDFNKQHLIKSISNYYLDIKDWGKILEDLWEYVENRMIYLDTENDPDFITWKLENKATRTASAIPSIIIHYRYGNGFNQDTSTFKNIEELKQFLNKQHCKSGIVIDTMENFNNEGITLHNICKIMNILYVGVSKITYDKLEKINIPFRIKKECIYKSKRCQKIVDSYSINISSFLDHIKLPEHIVKFVKSLPVRNYNDSERRALCKAGYTLSEEAIQARLYISDMEKKISDIQNILETQKSEYILYYGIKNKLFFVKAASYNKIKENKIIKYLCKK